MKKYLLMTLIAVIVSNAYAQENKPEKPDNLSNAEASSNMPILTPPFYGIIYRKNERTKKFIERETELLLKHFPGSELNQNEDLIGFPAAMNSLDLRYNIKKLEEEGLVYRTDFVVTASNQGVIDMPEWLTVTQSKDYPGKKLYSLTPGH
ncbi:MAG: hypothetical protein KDI90_05060 [Alphaproteobacteria bacterium]|nr:hypothetical protein [Alphaproteobacteria bacterium]MCB9975085.1 hypothetical protein [Rhodospirillales bacterium]